MKKTNIMNTRIFTIALFVTAVSFGAVGCKKKEKTVAFAVSRNTNVAQTCKRTKEKKRQTRRKY
jgi:hypothetical protein